MSETAQVRAGEELDIDSLRRYLSQELPGDFENLEVRQFPSGASNLTYLISSGDEEFVLRRPPFGNPVKTAHDMQREFRVLSSLESVFPSAPVPVLFCDDETVIGSDFYLMERCRGIVLRGSLPHELASSAEMQTAVARSFIENLAELHAVDWQNAGLGDLGRAEGYVQRQIEGWGTRYRNAKTDNWPELEHAIEWLNTHIPDDKSAALIHNDYKFDNLILDPGNLSRIVAILDWEMATIGSPLMDLGTTLGYWMSEDAGEEMLSMPFNPRILMERISRHDLAQMYAARSGSDLPDLVFYYVYGLVKIAVIAQQIFYRFKKGHTTDPRFGTFNFFVRKLGVLAWSSVQRNTI